MHSRAVAVTVTVTAAGGGILNAATGGSSLQSPFARPRRRRRPTQVAALAWAGRLEILWKNGKCHSSSYPFTFQYFSPLERYLAFALFVTFRHFGPFASIVCVMWPAVFLSVTWPAFFGVIFMNVI